MNDATFENGYGAFAKTFHWLIAGLLAAQFTVGWLMPHINRNTPNAGLVSWHLSIGTAILFILVLRLVWRFASPVQPAPGLARWEQTTSLVTHGLLYVLVAAMTLLGWAAVDRSSIAHPVGHGREEAEG